MKNVSAGALFVAVVVLSITVLAEYVYLKRVFEKKYAQENTAEVAPALPGEAAGSVVDSNQDVDRKLRVMEGKYAAARASALAKDRRIAELEGRLKKSAQYAKVALIDIDSANKSAGVGAGPVSFAFSSRKEMGEKLEDFLSQFSVYIEDEGLDEYESDVAALMQSLSADQSPETLPERKASMLSGLQEQIEASTSDREKEMLKKRMEKISNASEADLDGVLGYYQRLDDIKALNEMMAKYNIAREELRSYGIEPPPRSSWGPDVLEVAMNLENYTAMYKPLVASDKQAQFEQDFSKYLDDLTRRYTREEVNKTRTEWMDGLRVKLESSTNEREKGWLERRMEGLQKADVDEVRKWMQHKKVGEVGPLIEQYGIPQGDLRQSGVAVGGRGRHHHKGKR